MELIKYFFAIFVSLVTVSQVTFANETKSDERKIVSEAIEAIEAIEMCYHWAGEVGEGDEERQKQIANGFERDCPVATSKARNAYSKYPNNAELINYLFYIMDIGYFDVSNETKSDMCKKSFEYYKDIYESSSIEDDFYKDYCPELSNVLYRK